MTPPVLPTTRVGDVELPELPRGWFVYVDTEGSGIHADGEPFAVGNRPAAPPARLSVVSLTFRQPVWNEKTGEWYEGDLIDYAWPFDQGPILGKPGHPVKDPETGIITFRPIDETDQAKLLARMSAVYGYQVTPEMACPNLSAADYVSLIEWIDRRDYLGFHNSKHDMHQFRSGLRAGAGGNPDIPEGYAAWDPDSEPGTWERHIPQRIGMMAPSGKELQIPGNVRRRIWDTQLIQKQLIDPLEPAALKPTARRLWGNDAADEEVALQAELKKLGVGMTKRYDLLPWCGAIGKYAAADTRLGYDLKVYQFACAEEGAVPPRFWELAEKEHQLRTTLYRMERRGVPYAKDESFAEAKRAQAANDILAVQMPFDPNKLAQSKRFYFGPVCATAQNRFDKAVAEDGNATRAWQIFFCDRDCPECGGRNGNGYEPTNRTTTGLPQLNIAEVWRLQAEQAPWSNEYLLFTKRKSAISKWYIGWAARVGSDGRLRTSFRQTKMDRERPGQDEGGTKSGRLAVTRWQAQAIPHGGLIPEGSAPVRPFILDIPGYKGYEHDLATGEVRVVAVVAGSHKLWDAIENGADLHAMNAEAFFGVTPENTPDPDVYKGYRTAAKKGTFGTLYGGGPKALKTQMEEATGRNVPMHEAAEAIRAFYAIYPELKRTTDQATAKVTRWQGGPGFLTMLDGWRRWYAVDEKTNSAFNQVIQGNLARAMINWMISVEIEVPDCLLLQIHDSLVTIHPDTPEGEAQARLVSEIGEREFRRYFKPATDRAGREMAWGIEPERWDSKH